MSRLQDFTEVLRNPHAWIGAISLAVLITVPTGLLDKLNETPRNTDIQQAGEMEQVQREETIRAERVTKQINECVARRGPGAAPVFDKHGFVVGCERRKS